MASVSPANVRPSIVPESLPFLDKQHGVTDNEIRQIDGRGSLDVQISQSAKTNQDFLEQRTPEPLSPMDAPTHSHSGCQTTDATETEHDRETVQLFSRGGVIIRWMILVCLVVAVLSTALLIVLGVNVASCPSINETSITESMEKGILTVLLAVRAIVVNGGCIQGLVVLFGTVILPPTWLLTVLAIFFQGYTVVFVFVFAFAMFVVKNTFTNNGKGSIGSPIMKSLFFCCVIGVLEVLASLFACAAFGTAAWKVSIAENDASYESLPLAVGINAILSVCEVVVFVASIIAVLQIIRMRNVSEKHNYHISRQGAATFDFNLRRSYSDVRM